MATLADLPLKYRLFMGTYRYRRVDWTPGAALKKPLSQSPIAVITTAAFYTPDQRPFAEPDRHVGAGDAVAGALRFASPRIR